jgi:Uma2 family endonuclease
MATTPAERTPRPLVPPRSPTVEEWERMSPQQRADLEQSLSQAALEYDAAVREAMSAEELAAMGETDMHHESAWAACDALRAFFRRIGGSLYVSSNLPVYYPGDTHFDPDLLAVRDVPVRQRDSYVVQNEGKGLDLVVEVLYKGNRKKDLVDNVTRYARLGIPEYFVADLQKGRLHGYRLPTPDARRYTPLLGDHGRYRSTVLGLDLTIEQNKLRFYSGTAIVPLMEELAAAAEERAMVAQENAAAAQEAATAAQEAATAAQETAAADRHRLRQALVESLLLVLKLRQLPMRVEQQQLIQSCQDLDLLERWLRRAATASLDELFLDA